MTATVGLTVLLALSGLLVGSVAGHVAEAVLARRRLAVPRCPYCTTPYQPYQWSATVALVSGQWRCATCRRPSRLPRLLGELFLAVAWATLVTRSGLSPRVILAMAALVPLAMVLVTDLEAKLVPNAIMLPSLGAMVILGTLFGPGVPFLSEVRWWHSLAGAAVGFAIFRILVWIGVALFGEGALGEGRRHVEHVRWRRRWVPSRFGGARPGLRIWWRGGTRSTPVAPGQAADGHTLWSFHHSGVRCGHDLGCRDPDVVSDIGSDNAGAEQLTDEKRTPPR